MKIKKHIVKTFNNKGNSYFEMMISLLIMINLFVLITQIFYNINKINQTNIEMNVLAYETAISRIELDLKDAEKSSLLIKTNSLQYTINNEQYRYIISYDRFTLIIGNYTKTIYYIYDVKAVSFMQDNNLLKVRFTDVNNHIYDTSIILSQ